jgi:small-conductance mechanosensitive channel
LENPDLLSNDLEVSPLALSYLTEAARWGRFLAIMGFILCVITVVLSFFMPVFLTQINPYNATSLGYSAVVKVTITVVYLLLALLFFFPCLYLYKFSVRMQSAVKGMSQENFDESLKNLKSLFKFYGIFTIVILSFYALVFIVGIVASAMH